MTKEWDGIDHLYSLLDPTPHRPPPRFKSLIRVVRPKNVACADGRVEQATPSGWETLSLLRFLPPGVGGEKGRDIKLNKLWASKNL